MNKIESIGELKSLLTSQVLREIINERKIYFQKKVNEYVKALKITEAYGELCKLEDIENIYEVAMRKLKEIEKDK